MKPVLVEIARDKASIIQSIESLLQQAKNGEIKEFALAGVDHEHNSFMVYAGTCRDTYKMLGNIETMKIEYFKNNIEPYRKTV